MKKILLLISVVFISLSWSQEKIGYHLKNYLSFRTFDEPIKVWIFFKDKGNDLNKFYANPQLVVSRESLERRKKVFPLDKLLDYDDLPVNQTYLDILKNLVVSLRYTSRWFNAVSAFVYSEQLKELEKLPFVKKIELVEKFRKRDKYSDELNKRNFNENQEEINGLEIISNFNYGASLTQNQQINVVAVHNTGNYGQGVRICVMDAGFNRLSHEVFQNMNIIATWDFVNNRPYVGDGQGGAGSGVHGTQTLSTIGGFKQGQLIGPAFASSYILAKTENTESETPIEMDNWIAALEWADSIGVDITSTSLGYLEFDPPYPSYNWTHMDGNTVPITIAADLAVKRGIVVINSAGNEGFHPTRNTLVAPADGDSVIAVGAVTSTGARASFSSVGPTVDGRIKPDVMAMGSGVRVASAYSDNGYTSASGTSFSCPLAAGVAALILSENPSLTPMQVRDAMRNTASLANSPNREMGWGILNALQAVNYYNIVFDHNPPGDTSNLFGPYIISVRITSRLGINPASVKLFYGRGAITDSMIMLEGQNDYYYAYIYGNGQPAVYKYYIEARTSNNEIVKRLPKRAPLELLEFRVGDYSTVNVSAGWNLISVPVSNQNLLISNVFQNIASPAYYFDGRYISNDTIFSGLGFWLKFNNSRSYAIPGNPLLSISIPVKAGWNLIGTVNSQVPVYSVQSVPPNNILTPFYGYDGGYFNSPYLSPGKGYWVKVQQDGLLIINSNYVTKSNELFEQVISTQDKLLFEDKEGNKVELILKDFIFDSDLPPLPPNNAFDIRFIDSKMASSAKENYIQMQGVNFPLKVSLSPKTNLSVEFFDFFSKEEILKVNPGEIKFIDKLNSNLIGIRIIREKIEYQLLQNYPNPFNSKTKIKFTIPEKSKVTLKIYDLLGREKVKLLDKILESGTHEVNVDLEKYNFISSGIYFYKLETSNFSQTKKMIYLK